MQSELSSASVSLIKGAAVGAAAGSVIPGLGTAIGGILGAVSVLTTAKDIWDAIKSNTSDTAKSVDETNKILDPNKNKAETQKQTDILDV